MVSKFTPSSLRLGNYPRLCQGHYADCIAYACILRFTNDASSGASDLLFSVDSLKCERCGAKMRILCAIHPLEAIKKILDCLGIPSKPPPIFRAVLESDTEDSIR